MSEPCKRAGLQGWAEVEGQVVLHFPEGPRGERAFITYWEQLTKSGQ